MKKNCFFSFTLTAIIFALFLFPKNTFAQCTTTHEWENPKPQGNTLFAVSFPSHDTGYACGYSGTIVRTIDGGTSWTLLNSGVSNHLHGIYFTSRDTGYACGDTAMIVKTTNAGATWTPLTTGITQYLFGITFTSRDTGYACGFTGKIIKTTNGGLTWTTLTSPTTNNLLRVYFFSDSVGYIVGASGTILKTINAGTSWTSQTSGTTQTLNGIFFTSIDTGWAVGNTSTIRKTINGGLNWTTYPIAGTTYNDIQFINSNIGVIVGQSGALLRTINAGTSWLPMTSNTTQTLLGIAWNSPTESCVVGGNGAIITSSNTAATWTNHTSGPTDNLKGVDFPTTQIGYAVGYSGRLMKTFNGGTSWTAISSGTALDLYSVNFLNKDTGFIGGNGILRRTYNGGTNWTTLATVGGWVSAIFFLNKDTGYVSSGSASSGSIYKTINGGVTWSALTISSPYQLNDIYFGDRDTGYAVGGGNLGNPSIMFRTLNGGVSWTQITTPSPNSLWGVNFFSADTGFIVGITGTIWRTVNAGVTWTNVYSSIIGLYGITFYDHLNGFAVGGNGGRTVVLTTRDGGLTWAPSQSLMINFLQHVTMTDMNTGYCVGAGGAIFKLYFGLPSVTTSDVPRCGPGTVQLNASNGSGYNWYNAITDLIPAGTGTTFTTPFLNASDTFYVCNYTVGCESVRIPVIASIDSVPSAPTATGDTVCSGNVALLNATNGSNYAWYNSITGGSPNGTTANYTTPALTASDTFYVAIVLGNCESPRVPAIAHVIIAPPAPGSTDESRCDTGSVSFTASGATNFNWYDSPSLSNLIGTGSSFTISLTANDTFYVINSDSICASAPTMVIAHINPLPNPGSISGLTIVVTNTTHTYSVNPTAGSSYQWIVTGGTGTSAADTLSVTWGSPGVGSVGVIETDVNGCVSDTVFLTVNITTITGIFSAENNVDFEILPNPNNGTFMISLNMKIQNGTVEIYDKLGQLIQTQNFSGKQQNEISLQNLPSGIYFVRISSPSGMSGAKRVIVE